jgi:hypothetical protein
MSSHAVPRNMNRVERLWKGVPDRYVWVAVGTIVIAGALLIAFFYMTFWAIRLLIVMVFLTTLIAWLLLARSPRILDRSLLFGLFFIMGAAGYNLLTKYSLTDNKINKLVTIERFLEDGTIVFKNGHGWLYAYDPDNVNRDMLEGFTTKSQALLNSLQEDVFFKMEVRIEPKQDAQKLTERTNDLINEEKDKAKLAHLQSIMQYSQKKEKSDYEKRYYFFIGLFGKRELEEARVMKEKIEHGLQDKINNLDIIFSQIKDTYLLFEFYAGELR